MRVSRLEFPTGVAFQDLGVGQDSVLMSLDSGYLYRCNQTASIVLGAAQEGRPVCDAVAEICKRFEVDSTRASSDVDSLIADLVKQNLVRVAA